MKKIVLIGGGTGMPSLLRGLKNYDADLTAIVDVTDSGRSSGKLREELGILPPGDIRNCIASLSDSEPIMREILQYRFNSSDMDGTSLGNLMIAALTDIFGSFERAVEELGKILAIKGKVIPSTLKNVHLCAELEDGETRIKEHNVRQPEKSPIKRVYLDKKAYANPAAIEAIKQADLVVLGPGSLYTSIISNLLVEGLSEAITKSRAKKVYVCNIMTQSGQTDNFTASEHLNELINYLKADCIDFVILNSGKLPEEQIKSYKEEKAEQIIDDLSRKGVIRDDLIERESENQIFWEKKNLLRHNSEKVAKMIMELV